ncbi:PEP-CTERM protein-sorting domain-containing protein [Fontibacillus panacisegetis]|uniref:PEP-CTERM protein-sorting domain-containing protein n=1 Tax=Fontibacillus panacisegetis TaxID=670482 RepID=A0A1G7GRU7_9BACL|nr:hypothetical protein [Fontibacillus panacisegetis]SDE90870.1 PEP-CTERM protein-sorting domain-containing protein [Fontibacillus panacisegetis]
MSTYQIMKWIFLLCVVTLFLNGFLYVGIRKPELLYSLVSAAGLGLITGITALLTRKKK